MLFSSKRTKTIVSSLQVHIDGMNIECVDSIKLLGIRIDENLTWKTHISDILLKITRNAAVLRRIRLKIDS